MSNDYPYITLEPSEVENLMIVYEALGELQGETEDINSLDKEDMVGVAARGMLEEIIEERKELEEYV